jgi:GTPase-associated protein 1, N-terminal domain type 1
MRVQIDQQCHGYRGGHQLLGGSIKLSREDQDLVDRLSDISGPLRPSELFASYLTSYPLPSGSFYVLARTWQDLEVRRAGCVMTRSLFVPMSAWESMESAETLVRSLVPLDRNNLRPQSFEISQEPSILPTILATKEIELVEALFLEERQPIVVFDDPDAELITRRLLTAFWPSIRRIFSVCTNALGPRTIGGRPFDLVFAPKESRSRFASWEGRRIEGGNDSPKPSRHKWSYATAKTIFEEPQPSLTKLDTLGVLVEDQSGDESSLRLALMWKDLLEQSKSSATAILGMLDILQSRGSRRTLDIPAVHALIFRSIDLAARSFSPEEMLDFLMTLVGKITLGQLPHRVVWALRNAFSKATQADPEAAMSLLDSSTIFASSNSPILSAGFGDGLGALSVSEIKALPVAELPSETILRLLADSRSFARQALALISGGKFPNWQAAVVNALGLPDVELRKKASHKLIPNIETPEHAAVLYACLLDTDDKSIARAVRSLWKSTGLRYREFDTPIRDAATGTSGIQSLRSTILNLPADEHTNRFLASTFRATPEEVKGIFDLNQTAISRRLLLALEVIERTTDQELHVLSEDSVLVKELVAALLSNKAGNIIGANKIARLLSWSDMETADFLDATLLLVTSISGATRSDLINTAIARGLKQGLPAHDPVLKDLLTDPAFNMDIGSLIANATSSQANRERISNNITMLNNSPHSIRAGVLSQIDNLSDRLTRRNAERLDSKAIRAWAALLADSGSNNHHGQLRAASNVLSFALSFPELDVSPLIVAAFPIVYNELKEGREAPSLLSFLFTDWDRCKTARKDLVRAFIRSKWPATDLFLATLPTGDLSRVLRNVLRERDGERFMVGLQAKLKSLPKSIQSELEAALSSAIKEVPEIDGE